MASELANDNVMPKVDGAAANGLGVSNGADQALPNGTNEFLDTEMQTDAPPNHEAFAENSTLPSMKESVNGVSDSALAPNPNLPDPVPAADTTAGIAPVADFIPKDAPNLSHPTPPPDQPLTSGAADVDTEMQDQSAPATQDSAPAPEPAVPAEPIQSEEASAPSASLDPLATEPVEGQQQPEEVMAKAEDSLLNGISETADPTPDIDAKPASAASVSAESNAAPSLVRPREDDETEEPAAKRTRVEEPEPSVPAPSDKGMSQDAKPAPTVESQSVASQSVAPSQAVPAASPVPTSETAEAPAGGAQYGTGPIAPHQKVYLVEKMKNNKKTKHAIFFLNPVDHVKLNIPTYPDIIKNPMDLGTMETKLKNDQYPSLQAFADDFHQIIANTEKFNGLNHAVTHAGHNMQAYFEKFMQTIPSADQKPTTKISKKNSPAPHRPARQVPKPQPPPPPPAPERSNSEAFALHPDGTPQIRRDSQAKRPARAIKPPPSREVTYPKPKRKEHQLELRFCEHVLDEARSPRYGNFNHVFLMPVDPVALNIPHYRQIIKNPMDMTTMAQKLKQGQYGKASEFKRDFELMVDNCLTFNPPGNPVRDLGIEMRRVFESLWAEKSQWERKNKPKSSRASSASADESAAEESEEEEEADGNGDAQATIAALSKQLADMQNQLLNMGQGNKAGKNKKAKDIAKTANKRKSVASSLPKYPPVKAATAHKPKPKKQKPVSYDDKQEISSAVEKMDPSQIEALTQIITQNCAKYRDVGDEMELEIDDLPEDVQRLLLKHVRSIFGNPSRNTRIASPDDVAAMDDDDFEPPARAARASHGGESKRKKHKPMGKKEQQDSINALRSKLAAFNNESVGGGSESPLGGGYGGGGGDQSSGDEESEESEEE